MVYYAAGSLVFSFYAIWLSSQIGLSARQTGIVYSLNFFIALIIMFIYGVVQDKLVFKEKFSLVPKPYNYMCSSFPH